MTPVQWFIALAVWLWSKIPSPPPRYGLMELTTSYNNTAIGVYAFSPTIVNGCYVGDPHG